MSFLPQVLTLFLLWSVHSNLLAQTCNNSIPESVPNTRYTVNSNGTVLDKQTGLTWKQCIEGQMLSSGSCVDDTTVVDTYTWQLALQRAQTVNGPGFAGNTDWRVPNIRELRSLHEIRCVSPAINEQVFPNTPSNYFWSSSPDANSGTHAWLVYFDDGYGGLDGKNGSYYVRLVRGGQ